MGLGWLETGTRAPSLGAVKKSSGRDMTLVQGWGRYPVIDSEVSSPTSDPSEIAGLVKQAAQPVIARGMGRSYGDSSLSALMIDCRGLKGFLSFDQETGVVRCRAGVTLSELLRNVVPKGWFLPVAPGTKFITVGGAIASDVHGKNHHVMGCFSNYVESFDLLLAEGEIVNCSRSERSDLFHATFGGMGLTGIVVEATLSLQRIRSTYIEQTTLKAENLAEALWLLESNRGATYSVAWIDCLKTGAAMGRSLLMLGEHAESGGIVYQAKRSVSVPFDMPALLLNRYSVGVFNALYYHRIRAKGTIQHQHYEPFFYPLDAIHHWNRLYGKRGVVQYQFVIPKAAGLDGLTAIFERIVDSRRGSFLAVLKTFGAENANLLSFPLEGYTLAVDFKMDSGLLELLNELDAMVLDHGGRLYLAKDSRMSENTFKRGYLRWEQFQEVRERYGALGKFASDQSRRIGLG